MGRNNMFGVVLWSDPQERKAVIWCEDHGDLAFYKDEDPRGFFSLSFDAGDVVEFDVTSHRNLRYAQNPQVVTEGQYRDLPGRLRADEVRGGGFVPRPALSVAERLSADVLPFPRRMREPDPALPVRCQG